MAEPQRRNRRVRGAALQSDGTTAAPAERCRRRTAGEQRRQLAAIVEQAADAIVGYAPDGTITSWNPAAERLYGFGAADVIGRRLDGLPAAFGELCGLLARAAAGEAVQNYETVQRTGTGELRAVSLTLAPVRDAWGAISGFSSIARDISGDRRTEETLRRQNGYLSALHELTLGLINHVEVAGLIEAIVTRAAALLQASDGFICLVSADGEALELAATTGDPHGNRTH
ncbi:MAG TPA: PAS domain-containing protein, partial [Dehalococcoidia bacterium]